MVEGLRTAAYASAMASIRPGLPLASEVGLAAHGEEERGVLKLAVSAWAPAPFFATARSRRRILAEMPPSRCIPSVGVFADADAHRRRFRPCERGCAPGRRARRSLCDPPAPRPASERPALAGSKRGAGARRPRAARAPRRGALRIDEHRCAFRIDEHSRAGTHAVHHRHGHLHRGPRRHGLLLLSRQPGRLSESKIRGPLRSEPLGYVLAASSTPPVDH